MHYETLLEHFRLHVQLTAEEEVLIEKQFDYKSFKAKQFVYHEGEVNRALSFVVSGCLRSYAIDENGFEHILQFAPKGWWISDMQSIQSGQPAKLNIDAVQPSEVLFIYRDDLMDLFKQIPKLDKHFRILGERAMITYQNRLLDNLSLSALDRYQNFCKRYPNLILEIPQKQVAAYIGVTPEFLSKMLNKVKVVA